MNLAEKLWKTADEANAKAHADFYAEVADKKEAVLALALPQLEKAAADGKTYIKINFSKIFPDASRRTTPGDYLKIRSALRTLMVIFEREGIRLGDSNSYTYLGVLEVYLYWNKPEDQTLSHWGYLPR